MTNRMASTMKSRSKRRVKKAEDEAGFQQCAADIKGLGYHRVDDQPVIGTAGERRAVACQQIGMMDQKDTAHLLAIEHGAAG